MWATCQKDSRVLTRDTTTLPRCARRGWGTRQGVWIKVVRFFLAPSASILRF